MSNTVAAVLIGLAALLGECGLASAQDKVDEKATQELKQVDPVPPATGKTLPEQAGAQEPSSPTFDRRSDVTDWDTAIACSSDFRTPSSSGSP